MQSYLAKLRDRQVFSREEAFSCFEVLFDSEIKDEQIAEFLTLLQQRELVASEMAGFLDYLSLHSKACSLKSENPESQAVFDVCGTGGDGKNTINISTLTAIILAAMGEKVAKHGNYSASSAMGSSNLLEALSVPFVDNEQKAQEMFSRTGIIFLHAPLWHPKLKRVAAVRKSLGFRTVFNMLGPLLNPAFPQYQLIGTPTMQSAELLSQVCQIRLEGTNRKFAVVSDLAGYDEVSLTANAEVFFAHEKKEISAADFGVEVIDPGQILLPATLEETVVVSKRLLAGLGESAHENVVAANCAVALQLRYPESSLQSLFTQALETVRSGKGLDLLKSLRSFL